jgi:NADH-quinone oxidoreductase subunit C
MADGTPGEPTVGDAEVDAGGPAPDESAPMVEARYGVPLTKSRGQDVLHPDRAGYHALIEALRADGYWVCVDLCGVDYLDHPADRAVPAGVTPERFEVVSNHLDHRNRRRIRVRLQVPADDPTVPSIADIHPGVHNHERETWDMFGIVFDGHHDLTRILMPDDWEGHPLRKDYDVGRIPVQFKAAPAAR